MENKAWETEFECGHSIIDRRPKGPDAECPFCAYLKPFKISRALVYRDDLDTARMHQDAADEENDRLREQLRVAREALVHLNKLLDWAVANRGTASAFVTCYTYGYDRETKRARFPDEIVEAEAFLTTALAQLEES